MHPILALRVFFLVLFGRQLPLADFPPKFLTGPVDELEPPEPAAPIEPVEALPPAIEDLEKPDPHAATAPLPKVELPNLEGAAAQTLGVLQREGRLLDFLFEDIEDYDDADIGAAVREVHRGCKKAITEHFDIAPVRFEDEDSSISVPSGFDPNELRLVGNVVGEPPFTGTLKHKGYRATAARLPRIPDGDQGLVIAPAEVEL